ncbi:hypothetical protein BKA57DRAFT_507806 [Linnemannia elongata]|nr:hypothetical protein BKA57DRAFT_507806 [Linnemannia elongata]
MENPWTTTKLETLRCQIRGLNRLDRVEEEDPVKDTPELSLRSALGLLSYLKELEVFGFEGFDLQLGTKEVDWMAENWPALRMLRGLQKDTFLRVRFDEHKALFEETPSGITS